MTPSRTLTITPAPATETTWPSITPTMRFTVAGVVPYRRIRHFVSVAVFVAAVYLH
jgi:hypothetical protein